MSISLAIVSLLLSSSPSWADQPCEDGQAAVYSCSRVDLAAFVPIDEMGGSGGQSLNDVWGWTDPDSGREFAVVGRSGGTSFVEVTEPTAPVYLGDLPTRSLTRGDALAVEGLARVSEREPQNRLFCHDDCDAPGGAWRDVKVYQHYALIVSEESGHGLQVFDLTRLLSVEPGSPETFDEDAHYGGFGNAHNIELNAETGMAYAVGTSNTDADHNYNGGPHFVDVSDPLAPEHAGGYGGDGYTHDAQCVIYQGPDERFEGDEICFNSNEDSLTLVNVSDHDSPVQISRTDYPRVGYTHQGWLSEDQRWFYLNDETADTNADTRTRTLIFDVADLESPELANQYFSPDLAIAHNNYVRGDYLFQSNYTSGLRILDISTPDQPVEVAYFDSQPGREEHAFQGTWSNYPWFDSGTVVFTDIVDGLFIVQPRLPSAAEGEADLVVQGLIESMGAGDRDWSLTTRITVENQGPESAPAVEFVASLPASGELTVAGEAPGDCDNNGRVLRCRYGDLGSGESFLVDLEAEADDAPDEGLMVWAVSDRSDPNTGDNRRILPRDGESASPVALFSANCDGRRCQLDASQALGGQHPIARYEWDLGDGSEAEGKSINHRYGESGDYSVSLTVVNENGEEDVTTRTVTVASADGSGGSSSSSGCRLGPTGAVDPLLPGLMMLSLVALLFRRRYFPPFAVGSRSLC